jgi:outer membrane receptor for ferrienterochelin and colicins
MPAAQAQATAAQAAGALTPLMAAIPVGATAFTNALHDQPYLVYTYRNAVGYVNVTGQDLSADLQVSDNWFVSGAYSHLSNNVFTDAPGATLANPLAANTPKHRASAAVRFERFQTELRGFSTEVRGRYADAFPVNSGVLNSYGINTPVRYEPVPVNMMLDANVTWRIPVANRRAQFTVNATNLLDNKVRTFVGVPEIGRMLTTRLQYTF